MLRYGGHPRNEAVKAPRLTNGRSENKRFASVRVQSRGRDVSFQATHQL